MSFYIIIVFKYL